MDNNGRMDGKRRKSAVGVDVLITSPAIPTDLKCITYVNIEMNICKSNFVGDAWQFLTQHSSHCVEFLLRMEKDSTNLVINKSGTKLCS